jgi:hypothetical protein
MARGAWSDMFGKDRPPDDLEKIAVTDGWQEAAVRAHSQAGRMDVVKILAGPHARDLLSPSVANSESILQSQLDVSPIASAGD